LGGPLEDEGRTRPTTEATKSRTQTEKSLRVIGLTSCLLAFGYERATANGATLRGPVHPRKAYSPEYVEGAFREVQLTREGCWPEAGKNAR